MKLKTPISPKSPTTNAAGNQAGEICIDTLARAGVPLQGRGAAISALSGVNVAFDISHLSKEFGFLGKPSIRRRRVIGRQRFFFKKKHQKIFFDLG
jgi:hypothetical protein